MRWEYLVRRRHRDRGLVSIGGWKDDVTKDLVKLGNDEWELVAITSAQDANGLTTEQTWVFKRPALNP